MIDNLGGIASALNSVRQTTGSSPVPARAATAEAGPASFAEMLSRVASDSVGTMRAAESSSIESIRGKASVQQVVDAVMAAEQTLQATIAVRDKLVGAYQELTRMQI